MIFSPATPIQAEEPQHAVSPSAAVQACRTPPIEGVQIPLTPLRRAVMVERILGVGKTQRRILATTEDVAAWVAELGPIEREDRAGGFVNPGDPSITLIPLDGGQVAQIDSEDYPLVRGYCWSLSQAGYAISSSYAKTPSVWLHRLVMMAGSHTYVDHKKHDKLDNRKSQLRVCTATENSRNSRLSSRNSSGIKGISKTLGGWRGFVVDGGKTHYKDTTDFFEAVQWMVQKRRELHGEFACNAATPEMAHFVERHLEDGVDYLSVGDTRAAHTGASA